jgi:hypothetical protein
MAAMLVLSMGVASIADILAIDVSLVMIWFDVEAELAEAAWAFSCFTLLC